MAQTCTAMFHILTHQRTKWTCGKALERSGVVHVVCCNSEPKFWWESSGYLRLIWENDAESRTFFKQGVSTILSEWLDWYEKIFASWKKSYDKPRQHIKKQRHYVTNKGPSSQGYGFPSSHVWMWELDYKESWVQKDWCFWTVVLEKTPEEFLGLQGDPTSPS